METRKTYTMVRSGDNETKHFDYFYTCKQFASTFGGQWVVQNNRTGKTCLMIANSQIFKVYKWK